MGWWTVVRLTLHHKSEVFFCVCVESLFSTWSDGEEEGGKSVQISSFKSLVATVGIAWTVVPVCNTVEF